MMRKTIILLLIAVLLFGCLSCSAGPATDNGTKETEGESEPDKVEQICETADEMIQKMTYGWNLGLAMSFFRNKPKNDMDGWQDLVYLVASDNSYNRSDTFGFDPETGVVEISWTPGNGGVLAAAEDATILTAGVELWNFFYYEGDKVTFKLESFSVVMADGTEYACEAELLKEYEDDMTGGTAGVGSLISFGSAPAIKDVASVNASIRFVGMTHRTDETEAGVIDAQTRWGVPVTTQEMINAVRDRGFNLIRIQVSYVTHMDSEGNIYPRWLDRVAEVVDYCREAGVYCLLTVTGEGWLTAVRETFPEQSKIYRRLWEQIAERFKDTGDFLLFESCNEILNANRSWTSPGKEAYEVMNELLQIFVDTVRGTGGYNETRNLVLVPYGAIANEYMLQKVQLPADSVSGHLIGEVHCYEPNAFCFNEYNLGSTNFRNEWGTWGDQRNLESNFQALKQRFVEELKIPVIIGEFGVVDRPPLEERVEYMSFYSEKAAENGIKLVIFDDGGDFTVFNRWDLSWPYPELIDALIR